MDQINEKRIDLLYHQFCNYANIQETEKEYYEFAKKIEEELITLMYKPIATNLPVVVKKEVKKLDPEIEEAIFITNEAMKSQKEIVEKISYINKLRNDYYKKY
jgi:hypothetical protein